MNKKPLQSKKFVAFVTGTTITTVFTIIGLIGIISVPIASAAIVSLLTISLASINGVIGLYAVGQSAVDWKVYGRADSSQKNSIRVDERETDVQYENDTVPAPFALKD